MKLVCPTVTATNLHEYREQMERLELFAKHVHLDVMDGELAPTKSPALENLWVPDGMGFDIHIMFRKPLPELHTVISMGPRLAIIHAEAEGVTEFLDGLEGLGIMRGVALLQNTSIAVIDPYLDKLDHVLIFSGNLGYHGGTADLQLLDKVQAIKQKRPEIEIGWDGGINIDNTSELLAKGVDVFNVGGFIHTSDNPAAAYKNISNLVIV